MSSNDGEPGMGKNFFLALLLSMLVIFGYPALLRVMNPPQFVENSEVEQEVREAPISGGEQGKTEFLEEIPGPFIERPTPPTVVPYENELYEVEFSTLGGAITQLCYKGEIGQSSEEATVFYKGDPSQPGIFGVRLLHEKEDLTQRIFEQVPRRAGDNVVEFVFEQPGEFRMVKRYTIGDMEPVIELEVRIENLSPRERHFPIELVYGMEIDETDAMGMRYQEAVAWTTKVEAASIDKLAKKGFQVEERFSWSGVIKKYFAFLVKPNWKAISLKASVDKENLWSTVRMEPISLDSGESATREFLAYVGSQRYEGLKSFGLGFESILSKGFFGLFKTWLLVALKFLNRFTHNYGFAIILLTLLLKGLFAPLTHMSYKSMKKMQAIQPKLKAIQEKHKKEPEKLNRETMELFKKNRVNPMAGCWPMLIQMPVLFAMFRLLPEAVELKGAPFIWWIKDLSQPDQLFLLPFTIPILGWSALNLLPILMAVSQYGYQKILPQPGTSPEQNKIMMFMPVIFGFICYNMSSGLVLYWFVQNILTIIQQVFVNRIAVVLHHDEKA